MKYLVSFKMSQDAPPSLQSIEDEHTILNFIRKAMLTMKSMDETSADLQAIAFLQDVKPGHAKALEHPETGRVLVVQVDNDD